LSDDIFSSFFFGSIELESDLTIAREAFEWMNGKRGKKGSSPEIKFTDNDLSDLIPSSVSRTRRFRRVSWPISIVEQHLEPTSSLRELTRNDLEQRDVEHDVEAAQKEESKLTWKASTPV